MNDLDRRSRAGLLGWLGDPPRAMYWHMLANEETMNRNTYLGKAAWLAIGIYEMACPHGAMLCEVLDDHITRQPILMRGIIFYTALHAANLLPQRYDLIYQLAVRLHHDRSMRLRRIRMRSPKGPHVSRTDQPQPDISNRRLRNSQILATINLRS